MSVSDDSETAENCLSSDKLVPIVTINNETATAAGVRCSCLQLTGRSLLARNRGQAVPNAELVGIYPTNHPTSFEVARQLCYASERRILLRMELVSGEHRRLAFLRASLLSYPSDVFLYFGAPNVRLPSYTVVARKVQSCRCLLR